MPEEKVSLIPKEARKVFSRLGIALAVNTALTIALVYLLFRFNLYEIIVGHKVGSASEAFIISFLVQYGIGGPVFYLMARRISAAPPAKGRVKGNSVFAIFIICCAFMYFGAMVSNFVVGVIYSVSGVEFPNATIEELEVLANEAPVLLAVITAVIGPIFEEFMFRKIILDRTRVYGEKTAILFSALMFGFAHANIHQFFYAFFLGLVLGYVYIRCGKMWVTSMIHGLLNFIFSVLPMMFLRSINAEKITELAEDADAFLKFSTENWAPLLALGIFSLLEVALAIVGSVIFFLQRKKIFFKPAEKQLPSDSELSASMVNAGAVIFVMLSVAIVLLDAFVQ